MQIKLKNHRTYTFFIALCMVLLSVILLTACGNKGGKEPKTETEAPIIVPNLEPGVYYYDVVGGEVVLTLSDGDTFTLTGPTYNRSGKYTFADQTLILDFVKDEDGTAAATIENDVITLNYNGVSMRLLKKVFYTVTFNSNGGSPVEPMTVVNGKSVAHPNDPTRDGFVFAG